MGLKENMQKALNQAIEFEDDGIKYFNQAKNNAKSPLSKQLFTELIIDETAHKKAIKEIYDNITNKDEWKKTDFEPRKTLSFESIFKQSEGVPESALSEEKEAIDHAVKLEQRGINLYEELSSKAEQGPEKEFYSLLSQEEEKHRTILLDMQQYLEDPGAWEIKHGKASLDGGGI